MTMESKELTSLLALAPSAARRKMMVAILTMAPLVTAQPPQSQESPKMVGSVPYEKQATRGATEAYMLGKIQPSPVTWGDFYLLGSFPFKGFKTNDLATVLEPESELANMQPGGPGPDLKKVYKGKGGADCAWIPLGNIESRKVDFKILKKDELTSNCIGYLYGTVTASKPVSIEVPMGSDDGLRYWLNGKLLVDKDVDRGLDPYEDRVKLDLQPGVNHVLIKITQGMGGYEYQMMTRKPLDPMADAMLNYYLDLDFPATPEAEYYRAITIPVPNDVVLEVGGLDTLPDGRPVVSTRRGEVYIVDGAYDDPPVNAKFKRFAFGLHEPLGLAVRVEKNAGKQGWAVYCTQRGEFTRLIDTNGDEVADEYQTVSDAWGVSGNYHEFAFGPKFDPDGNAWVTLNVGFCGSLGKSVAEYRGWAIKIKPDGSAEPWCDGLRSPNGIGFLPDGAAFYVDNQGDYVGTCRMTVLAKDSWAGHPASTRWRKDFKPDTSPADRLRATIWFPYPDMGQSTADILLAGQSGITPGTSIAKGSFGPFDGQLFCGDQTQCLITRVDLEKIDGHYQGACFPFRKALDCGVNRICWGRSEGLTPANTRGSMFVGQTDRGWGSIGRLRYGLQRIVWTGKTPFECQTMRLTPEGFELKFTEALDEATAKDAASYAMDSWTYKYYATYGSPQIEERPCKVAGVSVVDDRTVRLTIEGLRDGGEGYVHHLRMPGVKSKAGASLLHEDAYYTLVKRVK